MVFLKYYHEFLYSVEKDGLFWSWSIWYFNTDKMIPCPFLALIWQVWSAYFSWKSWVSWHLIPKEPWASRVYIHREDTKLDVTEFAPIISQWDFFPLGKSSEEKYALILGPSLKNGAELYWTRSTGCYETEVHNWKLSLKVGTGCFGRLDTSVQKSNKHVAKNYTT